MDEFSRIEEPEKLGVFEPLRKFLYPFPVGSAEDRRWLRSPMLFMNTTTDRPFLLRQMFLNHGIQKSAITCGLTYGSPLESVILIDNVNEQTKDLREALSACVEQSRDMGKWAAQHSSLVYDSMSLAGCDSARWIREKKAALCASKGKWFFMIVGVRVRGIVAQGHAVLFMANIETGETYLFDPNARGDKAEFCLAATVFESVQRLFKKAGLDKGHRWNRRVVIGQRIRYGPQYAQNTKPGKGPDIAGAATCSAWCVLFAHLFLLHKGKVDPVSLAESMTDPMVVPYLRQIIGRYGIALSTVRLSAGLQQQRQITIAKWQRMTRKQKLSRYRSLVHRRKRPPAIQKA